MIGAFALVLIGGATEASAQGWSSFKAAFPMFPCQDGWMGCLAYGQHVDPEVRRDEAGRAIPADARVGWFDLKATAAFSPFVGLSQYPNESAVASAPPPEVAEVDEASREVNRQADEAAAEAEAARASRDEAQRQQAEAEAARRAAEREAATQREAEERARRDAAEATRRAAASASAAQADEQARLRREADEAAARAADLERKRLAAEKEAEARRKAEDAAKQRAAEEAARQQAAEQARQAAEARAAADAARVAEEQAKKVAPTAPAAAGSSECSDLQVLETKALLGQLPASTTSCLESSLASAQKMTDKKRISSVLMANAWAKGDKEGWETLVKRHLDEIDQSDPDLCYKYALHLSRQGPSRASGVIRWANVALENRMVWIGDTYTSRVYSLYKVRAAASQALWMAAEHEHTGSPTDETREKVDKYRNLTKVNAREWYEYAKSSGKDANLALQLCMSAAGTSDYCESN